ncbi:ParB/RepB/Spo0J family partition protein [Sphingomicrobium sp. XHP0239]|uniref:ParB/RepB/Spo0J family partition protein n=1 Tax=Sphingomicrobium maritimum TaxID=3133972 RepID=UPI0031CC50BA
MEQDVKHSPSAAPIKIDPTQCRIFPGNGRAEATFDAKRESSLVEDIRTNGQISSVLVRPIEGGYEVIAGRRRLGAILAIKETEPGRQLKAMVCDVSDETAWQIADKENANRRDLRPIQKARTWAYAIDRFHEGRQKDFAEVIRLPASTVSRTLRLLDLPKGVLQALRDPEAVSVHFATDFFRHHDSEEKVRKAEQIAHTLAADGVLFSPAGLLDALCLSPSERQTRQTRYVSFSGIEKHASIQRKRCGATLVNIKEISFEPENLVARKALLKSLHSELSKLLLPEKHKSDSEKDREAMPSSSSESR